ncbi:diphosphomevalonate decarboxylase [Chloroflexota bacterium]|nr:diphosphomevalonate decarboxylase [Chloroflexota bacterium]
MTEQATALAHPNIAFIKYWGLRDVTHRIPANDSLSMNIGCLSTRTTVTLDPSLPADVLVLNGQQVRGASLDRAQQFMDRIRRLAGKPSPVLIESRNNFPIGAGVASSASGFAALALAGTVAFGLDLPEPALSSLARFGSGSACRSIPGGFVEWRTDPETGDSYARSFAPADHWDLVDCIAVLSNEHKATGSEAGMRLANTSPLQEARVADAARRMRLSRQAILNRDFDSFAAITELDSNLMHAVMMTSEPPLFYWQPESLAIMQAVKAWQVEGLPVTYTLDAGPNVHVICLQEALSEVLTRLRQMPGLIEILKGFPAGPARLLPDDSQVSSQKV